MSNLASFKSNQQSRLPTPPQGDTIARFAVYEEAKKSVDYLSDHHFPVQAVTIVGVDLKMVERVTGRMTYPRAAMAGFAYGAYFGLMVGVLILLFGNAKGFNLPVAIIIGGAFGLLLGVISYGSAGVTGGRRDFTSTSQIVAGEYLVLCLTEQAGQATQLLHELARQGGPTSQSAPTPPAAGLTPPTSGQQPPAPYPSYGSPTGSTDETPHAAAPVTGPTYSEMIDRKKAEDRKRAEAERQAKQQNDPNA